LKKVTRVAVVNNVTAQEVIEVWEPRVSDTKLGRKIQSAVNKLNELVDDDSETRVMYADYTDKDRRWVFFAETTGETIPDKYEFPKEIITIVDTAPDVNFINWVIVKGSSGSALESMHKSGLWESQNYYDTAGDSIVIRELFPIDWIEGGTGQEAEIDYSPETGTGKIRVPPGTTITPNPQRVYDPRVREMIDRNRAALNSTSGVDNITQMDASNVQASVVSQLITLRMMELEPYKRNAEKMLAQLARLMFRWIAERKDTLVAKRMLTSSAGTRGEKISVSASDFDPDKLNITCTLLDKNELARKVNMFMQLKQGGDPIPWSEINERLDLGNPEKLNTQWEGEQINSGVLQAFVKYLLGQTDLKLKAEGMKLLAPQQQPQLQQPPQQQSGQPNPPRNVNQPTFDQASGMMTQNGAPSPYEQTPPQMTQTEMMRRNGQ